MIANSRCRGTGSGAGLCNTLRHRARRPLRSRPRKCTISSSTDVSVVTRPLRRFFRIASGRLLHAVRGPGRSLAILDSVDPAFVGLFGNKIQTEFLADYTGEKTAHGVLLPFGGRHDRSNRSTGWCPRHRKNASVLSVRPRRVFGDECVDRERGLDLLVVRAAERVEALAFDLDLVM